MKGLSLPTSRQCEILFMYVEGRDLLSFPCGFGQVSSLQNECKFSIATLQQLCSFCSVPLAKGFYRIKIVFIEKPRRSEGPVLY